jgi:hypothetical protein
MLHIERRIRRKPTLHILAFKGRSARTDQVQVADFGQGFDNLGQEMGGPFVGKRQGHDLKHSLVKCQSRGMAVTEVCQQAFIRLPTHVLDDDPSVCWSDHGCHAPPLHCIDTLLCQEKYRADVQKTRYNMRVSRVFLAHAIAAPASPVPQRGIAVVQLFRHRGWQHFDLRESAARRAGAPARTKMRTASRIPALSARDRWL